MCQLYHLPHPLCLLHKPMTKYKFKRLAKLNVTEYWQHLLASECNSPEKTSLKYFDPYKASLSKPHPMWVSSAGNAYETAKSTVWARMASGRYRTEMLSRFWTSNRSGFCLSQTCRNVPGTLEHLLISCPAIEHTRHRLHSLWCLKTLSCTPLHRLVLEILGSPPEIQVKFILDSTSFPQLIKLVQTYGQGLQDTVLYLTRSYAFAIHRHKMILLDRWPNILDKAKRQDLTTNDKTKLKSVPPKTNLISVAGCATLSPPSTSTQQVFSSERGSSQKAAVTVAGPSQPDSGHSSSLFVPVLTQLRRSYHNGLYHTTLLAPLRQGDHGQGVGCGECGGSALGRGHCVYVGRGQL